MFGFSLLIFYGVLSLMNISTAQDPSQDPLWSCLSFGSFEQSSVTGPVTNQYGQCGICSEKLSQSFFWFVTYDTNSFDENQPYFRAALNNYNKREGVSAECTLLDDSLPSSNGGLLSFRYIFNSKSLNARHGYFNYSVCKDEGTVHPLHVVEGWASIQHSFNCTEVEISFKAVRGDSDTNIGIDDVDVVQPGYPEARFNRFNLSRSQSEVSLTKKMSGRRVQITFSWQVQDAHKGGADLLAVFACENKTRYSTQCRDPNPWCKENISLSCDSNYFTITFKSNISVLLDDIQIYDLSEVLVQSTSSSGNIQTLSATTSTTAVLSTMGKTKPQAEEPIPRYILYVASSVAVTCLLLVVIIAIFLRRKCRSRSKPVSSQESDVDDTGLVINELYGECGASPLALHTLVDDDHAPSSSTTPGTLDTKVNNDMGDIGGDGHGGLACRSAHYNTTCDDITYHTLEAPTKDGCTIYQGQENEYADIEDNRYGVANVDNDMGDIAGDGHGGLACRSAHDKTACDGNTYHTLEAPTNDSSALCQAPDNKDAGNEENRNDKAWRSMSDKTTCHPNTYYNLEIPSKDDERHGEVSEDEYEDLERVNFPGHEDTGVNERFKDSGCVANFSRCDGSDAPVHFALEPRSLSPDAGTSSNKQQQNGNTDIRLSKDEEYDTLNFRTSVKKSSRHNLKGVIAEETENNMYGSLNVPGTSDLPISPDIQLINDNVYGNLSDVHVDPSKCQEEKPIASCVEPEATYQNM